MQFWWSESVDFIRPFALNHFIYIAILISILASLILSRDLVRAYAKRISTTILCISVLQQAMLYSWYFMETGFNVSESLPLHICRITSLLGILFLLTKNVRLLDPIFYFGLYAYGSFLYPQRIYPVYHVVGVSFVINHVVTLLLPYFGYLAYEWMPSLKGLIRSYIFFLVYFAVVYFLNPIIDGNYFYLKYRPFLATWPNTIYVPFVLSFTLGIFLLAYAFVKSIPNIKAIIRSMTSRNRIEAKQ